MRDRLRGAPSRAPAQLRFAMWSILALAGGVLFILGAPLLVLTAALRHRRSPLRPLGAA